jgi:hypothetical protein
VKPIKTSRGKLRAVHLPDSTLDKRLKEFSEALSVLRNECRNNNAAPQTNNESAILKFGQVKASE